MASTSSFSSPAEAVIERNIEVNDSGTQLVTTNDVGDGDIPAIYELDAVAREISEHGFKCIALQFPDELLHDAVPAFRELKTRLADDVQLYVLADTSYGSCCVDEVAAQHVDADVVVHFGHACLSRTSRLRVIYVFGRRALDAQHAINTLVDKCGRQPAQVKLLYDVAYAHAAEQIRRTAQSALPNATIEWSSPPARFSPPQSSIAVATPGQAAQMDENDDDAPNLIETDTVIFYIGAESLALSTVLMQNALKETYSYDPTSRTARAESGRTNGVLARRYALVHRARQADVFAIVVGTLGVASYLPLITHLRAALARRGKKVYTLAVGKLNPAKLANFPDVGCFVLVACPQTSVVDARDYFAPVVTPFELLLALAPGEPVWTGDYELDFSRLLAMPVAKPDDDREEDEPQYDFITGKLRNVRCFDGASSSVDTDAQAVVSRNAETALATGVYGVGAGFIHDRGFKGLEVNAGKDEPSILEQGRSGIARGYDTVAELPRDS
ncbi:diphthamide biosynthesis protein [Exidia glandulosa HHB12029]|uniref:2-(3-amino-3-carboxypropyl)histidine synthase subunit 2 n=1 Tax=Exidia glandulosa HHB12029 TaxID=1314781 RepID=A0A165P8N9_EXIGL|nr:diphthamide biosynthesis protein [Exidia glandulosa HHB12029]